MKSLFVVRRRPLALVNSKVESGQNPFHSSHSVAVKGMLL